MPPAEVEARQEEIDAFADWLMENGERNFMQYARERGIELDRLRGAEG